MGIKVLPTSNKCNEKDLIGITSSTGTLASGYALNKGPLTDDFIITIHQQNLNYQYDFFISYDNTTLDTEVTDTTPSKKNNNVSGPQSWTFNELSSLQCSSSRDSEVSVSTLVLIPICTQLDTNTYHS